MVPGHLGLIHKPKWFLFKLKRRQWKIAVNQQCTEGSHSARTLMQIDFLCSSSSGSVKPETKSSHRWDALETVDSTPAFVPSQYIFERLSRFIINPGWRNRGSHRVLFNLALFMQATARNSSDATVNKKQSGHVQPWMIDTRLNTVLLI